MTSNKTTTSAAEDVSHPNFLPVQLDLVDRLSREADTLAAKGAKDRVRRFAA